MMVALLLVGLAGCQQAPDGQAGSETQAEDGRATRELFALGSELDEAVEIAPGVFQARGTGNAHAVVTEDGVVVIDTGLSNQPRVQEQLRRAAPGKVSHVILTHAHADHYSATDAFADEDTEVVAHPNLPACNRRPPREHRLATPIKGQLALLLAKDCLCLCSTHQGE